MEHSKLENNLGQEIQDSLVDSILSGEMGNNKRVYYTYCSITCFVGSNWLLNLPIACDWQLWIYNFATFTISLRVTQGRQFLNTSTMVLVFLRSPMDIRALLANPGPIIPSLMHQMPCRGRSIISFVILTLNFKGAVYSRVEKLLISSMSGTRGKANNQTWVYAATRANLTAFQGRIHWNSSISKEACKRNIALAGLAKRCQVFSVSQKISRKNY